jgi:hypothetical protein
MDHSICTIKVTTQSPNRLVYTQLLDLIVACIVYIFFLVLDIIDAILVLNSWLFPHIKMLYASITLYNGFV